MPALKVLGQRLFFVADDDLRVLSKFAFGIRTVQLILLVPALTLILLARNDLQDCYDIIPGRTRARAVVWSFLAVSALTIVSSMVLEGFIFRVASRGSPTETQKRKELPCLCAVKLVPLSALRAASAVLGVASFQFFEDLCDPLVPDDSSCPQRAIEICVKGTVEVLGALAWTQIGEVGVSLFLSLTLIMRQICFHRRKRHQQIQQWLSIYKCNLCQRVSSSGSGGEGSGGSCWLYCCQCCCVFASCSTCCLFGGAEAVRNSGTQQSSLADISMILTDFFNRGGDDGDFLDVAPSDILVGLSVLSSEQRLEKRERFLRLQQEESELGSSPAAKKVKDIEKGDAPVNFKTFATGSFDVHDDDDEEEDDSSNAVVDNGDNRRNLVRSTGSIMDIQLVRDDSNEQAFFQVLERERLAKDNELDRNSILDGAHYMRLALAVYGHMMYLKSSTCSAPCGLLGGYLTCQAGSCLNDERPIVIGDNLCRLNAIALLRVAELDLDAVVYCNFKTGVEQCPYAIVVDRAKKSIVVVVRGTLSLEAAVTDLSIRPELLQDFRDKCEGLGDPDIAGEYCHSGMLKCALAIYEDLQRHHILDNLLLENARFPGFQLICCGHSLGAGVASVLGLLLRSNFPDLRCLCFAPPGCVLSDRASSQDFITSYVLDADIVPRLSLHSVEGLRDDVLLTISRIKVPKHIAFQKSRSLRLPSVDENQHPVTTLTSMTHLRGSIPSSSFYEQVSKFQEHQQKLRNQRKLKDVELYPPGRIVHLIQNPSSGSSFFRRQLRAYIPVWAKRADFAEIQVTRTLMVDHDPDRYESALNDIAVSFK